MCVNKWDGMRPKSPNSIHRVRPWCHIPPILALIGASYHLPNPIGFGGHLPPLATKTSPSRRLLSPLLSLLAAYCCAGFKGRQHLPHSSLTFFLHRSLSSPFTPSSFNASRQLQLLMQLLSFAWIILQCLTPCTSHHIEAQLQFQSQYVLINWIVANAWVDVLFCNGHYLLFWFSILCSLPIFWCTTNLLLLLSAHMVSWWFVGFLASSGTNNLGCWGGCAHLWAWMALVSLLMREQVLVRRGGKRCALKRCGQVRLAQRWREAGWSFNINKTHCCTTHHPAAKEMPSRWSLSAIACHSRAMQWVLMRVASLHWRSCYLWLRSLWVTPLLLREFHNCPWMLAMKDMYASLSSLALQRTEVQR